MTKTETPLILEARDEESLHHCFPLMHEFRPHLTLDQFLSQVQRQRRQVGYHLMYIDDDAGAAVSLIGYRLSEYLAWGKVLYIDDLATLASARRHGYASSLLKWAIAKAREEGCNQVHLDSNHQRVESHRLYAKHGFLFKTHHISLPL